MAYAAGWTSSVWDESAQSPYTVNVYASDPDHVAVEGITAGDALIPSVITTNLFGVCVTDVITQVSTTNYIPGFSSTLAFKTNTGLIAFAPLATNYATWTNVYFTDVSVAGIAALLTNDSGTYSCSTNFSFGGVENSCTTTVSRTRKGGIYPFKLDADDQRIYETFAAIAERELALRGHLTNCPAGYLFHEPSPGKKYYADMQGEQYRYNLREAKGWIYDNLSKFVDVIYSQSNAVTRHDFSQYLKGENFEYAYSISNSAWVQTNYAARSSVPVYTVTSLLFQAGAPYDWFSSVADSTTTGIAEACDSGYSYDLFPRPFTVIDQSSPPYYTYTRTDPVKIGEFGQLFIHDEIGDGYQFGQNIETKIKIIRYPASNWIVPTGWGQIVTNGYTNYVILYQTNFAYTYLPNEIITNNVYLWDGSTTNTTGTNGQVCTVSKTYYATSNYPPAPLNFESPSEYGWKHMRDVLSRLVITTNGATWSTNVVLTSGWTDEYEDWISKVGPSVEDYHEFTAATIADQTIFAPFRTNTDYIVSTNIILNTIPTIYRRAKIDTFGFTCYIPACSDTYLNRSIRFVETTNVISERLIEPEIECYTYCNYGSRFGGFGPIWESGTVEFSFGAFEVDEPIRVFWGDDNGPAYDHLPYHYASYSSNSIALNDANLGYKKYVYNTGEPLDEFEFVQEWKASVPHAAYTVVFMNNFPDNGGGVCTNEIQGNIPFSVFGLNTASGTWVSASCYDEDDQRWMRCNGTNGCCWLTAGMIGIQETYGNQSHEMDSIVEWDMYSVRNYATTNGFKYY